jgi:hypothetical protein
LNLTFSDEPTIIIWRATPRGAIEALEQWLQEQMPPCWKITCLAGCEFQAPQKGLRLINVYAISFMP